MKLITEPGNIHICLLPWLRSSAADLHQGAVGRWHRTLIGDFCPHACRNPQLQTCQTVTPGEVAKSIKWVLSAEAQTWPFVCKTTCGLRKLESRGISINLLLLYYLIFLSSQKKTEFVLCKALVAKGRFIHPNSESVHHKIAHFYSQPSRW